MAACACLADEDERSLALAWYARLAAPEPDDGVTRVAFRDAVGASATLAGARRLVASLEAHCYCVLTGAREGAARYRALEAAITAGFFLDPAMGDCGSRQKMECVGGVYENERGVPMWRCGYEFVGDMVREVFRAHAQAGKVKPCHHSTFSLCSFSISAHPLTISTC